jgi:NAD(P)-dependent dehydrogenase (short-subunit alcohol dehydrogenase family)
MMASYAITGASRGIGLELVKQLLEDEHVGKVFALSRGQPSSGLKTLQTKHNDRLIHVSASVDSTESVQSAAEEVETALGGKGLDVLVNNAGIQHAHPHGIRTMPAEQLMEVLDVNVAGPHRTIVAFLPLLEKGEQKKVINM